jgi:hypothetical protein
MTNIPQTDTSLVIPIVEFQAALQKSPHLLTFLLLTDPQVTKADIDSILKGSQRGSKVSSILSSSSIFKGLIGQCKEKGIEIPKALKGKKDRGVNATSTLFYDLTPTLEALQEVICLLLEHSPRRSYKEKLIGYQAALTAFQEDRVEATENSVSAQTNGQEENPDGTTIQSKHGYLEHIATSLALEYRTPKLIFKNLLRSTFACIAPHLVENPDFQGIIETVGGKDVQKITTEVMALTLGDTNLSEEAVQAALE